MMCTSVQLGYVRGPMVLFPRAKINIGLYVLRQRTDGYRDISTVMFPIPLHDMLEILPSRDLAPGEVHLTHSGRPVPGDPSRDLCLLSYRRFHGRSPLPGVRIHLHKIIPTGAGLGGGSSDAAQMLLAMDHLVAEPLSRASLMEMAGELGSDVPFFLDNSVQLAEGRGELLRPLELDLSGYWLLLVNPGIHVSTAEVYSNTLIDAEHVDLVSMLKKGPPSTWMGLVHNRMESYVFQLYPEIGELKDKVIRHGALYGSMSGSGSSIYGIFDHQPEVLSLPAEYEQWTFAL